MSVDITHEGALKQFKVTFESEAWPPIRGIFHAAGIVDDQRLAELSPDALYRVLDPKIQGAWLLANIFSDTALESVVFFSSAASLMGSIGAAHYCAANAFWDSYAYYLRAKGIAATVINLGPVAGIGMTQGHDAYFARQGILPLDRKQALSALTVSISKQRTHLMPISIKWDLFLKQAPNSAPFLHYLRQEYAKEKAASGNHLIAKQKGADSAHVDLDIKRMVAALKKHVTILLKSNETDIDAEHPLNRFGFDSIMAVQLQNEIEAYYKIMIPTEHITASTINALAERIRQATGKER